MKDTGNNNITNNNNNNDKIIEKNKISNQIITMNDYNNNSIVLKNEKSIEDEAIENKNEKLIRNYERNKNEEKEKNDTKKIYNFPATSPPRSTPNSPLLTVRTLHEMRKKGSEIFERDLQGGLCVIVYLLSREGETKRKHAIIIGEKGSSMVSIEIKSSSRRSSKSGMFH